MFIFVLSITIKPNMMTISEREETIGMMSDMFKDAYGCRPRGYNFNAYTDAQLNEEIDSLQAVIEGNIKEEEIAERANVRAFNELLSKTVELGAGDRKTALRWLYDGSGNTDDMGVNPWENFVWEHGMLFTAEGTGVVKELEEIYAN
jgi:hypothetical protein